MPKERAQRKAEHYAQRLLSIANRNSFQYRIAQYVLTHLVSRESKYASKPFEQAMVPQYVVGALEELARTGQLQPTWPDIEAALERARSAILAKPTVRYWVVYPLDLQGSWIQRKRWFTVLDTRLVRTTWQRVQQLPGWKQAEAPLDVWCQDEHGQGLDPFLSRFAPLRVELRARTREEALHGAHQAFDLLRALLNVAALHGVAWQDQGGRRRPLGFCLPPPFCLIFQSGRGNAPIALYSDVHYDYIAKEEMSPHRTMWFRRKLYQLNATKRASWPRSFLAHLVRLYGQAMDATDDSGAYLALWQVLEYATCPLRAKVDYERVQERVCCLLRPTDSTLQDALQCLLESRHDLVHEGRFPSGGLGSRHSHEAERVNALRLLVQLALYVVMPLVSKYPQPDELEHYYQYEVARMRLSKAKSALQVRSKTR